MADIYIQIFDERKLAALLRMAFKHTRLSDLITRFVVPCKLVITECSIPVVKPYEFDRVQAQRCEHDDVLLADLSRYCLADCEFFSQVKLDELRAVRASTKYATNSAQFLYDRFFSKNNNQTDLVLSLFAGTSEEDQVRTHDLLLTEFKNNYTRINAPKDFQFGPIDDISPVKLDEYIGAAQMAVKGWESFFRRLQQKKDSDNARELAC